MNTRTLALAGLIAIMLAMSLHFTAADPTGASIQNITTAGTPTSTAGNRSDARGTITTIILDSVQQDQNWKAYVGNITGQLSLDDADGNTIYDWALGAVNKSGEVYVSRYNSITWTNVSCIGDDLLANESTFYGMSSTAVDNVNHTYSYTNHAGFQVAAGITISPNSCRSTATYRNSAAQTIDGSQEFQSLILQDNSTSRVIYVAIINNSYTGFDNNQYDFQIIIPESSSGSPTLYYFYTRLSG